MGLAGSWSTWKPKPKPKPKPDYSGLNRTRWVASTWRNPSIRSSTTGQQLLSRTAHNEISGGRTTGDLTADERTAYGYYTSPTDQGGLGHGSNSGTYDPYGWQAFRSANIDSSGNFLTAPGGPLDLGGPGGGGSGGGYGGGGGGGGGGGALTQAMIDAMGRVLGSQGPQLQLQSGAMPAFQGQELGAFNAQPYTQATQQINTAQAADLANIGANEQATQQALQRNYTNDYANASVIPGAQAQTPGTALAATAGPGGGNAAAQATQQTNVDNTNSQAAFQNLLQVLAAASQQSQASRQAQVGMDANYGRQGVNAAASGLGAGVATRQAQASSAWGQQQQERSYQNNLMQQQLARQDAQRQADLANQQSQANWTQQNQQRQAALQPILQLIQQSGGQSGLNFNALFQALGIAS